MFVLGTTQRPNTPSHSRSHLAAAYVTFTVSPVRHSLHRRRRSHSVGPAQSACLMPAFYTTATDVTCMLELEIVYAQSVGEKIEGRRSFRVEDRLYPKRERGLNAAPLFLPRRSCSPATHSWRPISQHPTKTESNTSCIHRSVH